MNLKSIKYLSIFLLLFAFAFMDARAEGGDKKNNTLNKITGSPVYKKFNINRISTWFKNDGESDINPNGNSGFEYPRRSGKTAIFQAGLVWGGKVGGQTRVGGSSYRQGTVPGKILNSGVPASQLIGEDPNLDNVRAFRVRPDYLTGSVQAEIDDDEGSESEIREAYERDWMDWPAADGAPFTDVDGDGAYNPAVDIPGVPGADQTIWFVCNDTDPNQTQFMYGSLPMGIEEQVTVWGYNSAGPLGSMLFRKFKLINKSSDPITDMYVTMWNDPDLGDATDDFAGCDTVLSMTFVYNANPTDAIYGSNPAAAGFDFFQGPIVDGEPTDTAIFDGKYVIGKKNLPMTAHYFYINPDAIYRDPTQGQYQGTQEWYNFMQGRVGTTGDIFPDPFTGGTSVFALYGDPVAGTGWLDGQQHPAGDRRAGMASGPFTMAPGDTQEVVVAEIAAQGSNNINSVSLLKSYDKIAQDAYDKFFVLPSPPRTPNVSATGLDQQVVLNWGFDLARVAETESLNKENFTFQGYNIYQLPDPTATKDEAVRIATFDLVDGIKAVKDRTVDPVSGEEEIVVVQFGGDYGVKRSITIDKNYLTNTPLNNGSRYYFAVTSYAVFNQSGEPDPVQVPNNLENPFIVITVVPQSENPGVTYGEDPGSEIAVDHTTGLADGAPVVTVVDPSSTTGHEYEMFFTDRQEIRNETGEWVPASAVSRNYNPNDPDTLTGSSIDIAAVYGPKAGQLQLNCLLDLVSPDGNWSDGISLTFPAGVTVLEVPGFDAGNGHISPEIIQYLDSTVVILGDVSHPYTEDGPFIGGEEWIILVDADVPITVDWVIYDDGYSGGPVDASGSTTVTDVGNLSRTALYWNVKDLDAGSIVKLENQPVVSGVSLFPKRDDVSSGFGTNSGQVMDGLEVILNGSYDAPIVPFDYEITPINPANPSRIGTGSAASATTTVFANYTLYGLPTSWAIDGFGFGTDVVDDLQQDYELRYTGILDTSVIVNGPYTDTLITVSSGGQMATIFSTVAGGGGLARHPLNPNPGSTTPFLIRIPFEVWNKDTGKQVNIMFRDREQALPTDTTSDKFWSWYPNNRNYMVIVNNDYDPNTPIIGGHPYRDDATWIVVIYSTRLAVGDVVTITYANPFQIGVDTYRFKSTASAYSSDLAADDVNKINVFPNPYYGVNPQEINKYERFVTINHLPDYAKIRIFNLAGQLVRTIEKTTPGQFQRWDLLTDSGLPVASGLYIIYVDMPDLGRTKILKAAIIQEQQILDRF
ncbi:MAG: T9SS type A sorting domain-containing protein [bacterium]|nr:T9SS type A sorting domain-containing protein [bacterium]